MRDGVFLFVGGVADETCTLQTWAVVCEITYLDPQYRRRGESSIAFATRVKEMIADAAGLKPVPWDGLLKYRTPRVSQAALRAPINVAYSIFLSCTDQCDATLQPEIKQRRCQVYLNIVRQRFGGDSAAAPSPDSPAESPPSSPPR